MTKPRTYETPKEEAERLDALERRGDLDDLPFTRLRRYAKEPSQVYAIRIPVSRLQAIRWLADARKEQPTSLLREWVLERLDDELSLVARAARERSIPYGSRASSKKPPVKARGKAAPKKRGGR